MVRQAIVTGGTRGIGAAISRALAAAGYSVIACGLTEAECAAFAPDPAITTRMLDVTQDASVAALFEGLSGLDLLVNCAGVIQRGGKEFEIEAFRLTLEVNLTGTMRCCVGAKSLLAQRGGSIVNTASMLTFQGSPFVPGYSASKGGVGQLTKSLAAAWAPEGIRVNAICPGIVDTSRLDDIDRGEHWERLRHIIPMRRHGTGEDIANMCVYLCSDQGSWITGQAINVDGGQLTIR